MKSIIKNKLPFLISIILVVIMAFDTVSYAADSGFPGFSDSGYSDNGFSREEKDKFASQGAIISCIDLSRSSKKLN